MKKVLLIIVLFLSFAAISRSDPPIGFQYDTYDFTIRNWAGQYIVGAKATVSDSTWVDMGASTLQSDVNGKIIIKFLVPSTDNESAPIFNRNQVTFRASGYEDAVHPLDSHKSVVITMEYSH